jgi:hypothetical protein
MNAKNWFVVAGVSFGFWLFSMGNTWFDRGSIRITGFEMLLRVDWYLFQFAFFITVVCLGVFGYALYRAIKASK